MSWIVNGYVTIHDNRITNHDANVSVICIKKISPDYRCYVVARYALHEGST